MKALIIVCRYPPDLRVSARRWGNLVQYLRKLGVDCTVASPGIDPPGDAAGPAGEKLLHLPIPAGGRDARAPSDSGSARRSASWPGRWYLRIVPPVLRDVRAVRWLSMLKGNPRLLRAAREADCIIASYGPIGPVLLGWRLGKMADKPFILDVRDSFEARDGAASGLAKKISRKLESHLLCQAAARITVGNQLAQYLSKAYGSHFEVVMNGWTDRDVTGRAPAGEAPEPYLFYAGSIYRHQIAALALVLEALANHPDIRLRIRLLADVSEGGLEKLIAQRPISNRIDLLPPVEEETVLGELARSSGVLVLEDISGSNALSNGTVTGKLLGLLASGVPGIAVCSKTSEMRSIVDPIAGWHGVDSVEEMRDALSKVLDNREIVTSSEELKRFHMSAQARILFRLIEGLSPHEWSHR